MSALKMLMYYLYTALFRAFPPWPRALIEFLEAPLRKLAAGMTPEQVLEDHPRLAIQDSLAAEAFAADFLADEDVAFG